MTGKLFAMAPGILGIAAVFLLNTTLVQAADLRPDTLKAWSEYVTAAENRISGQLSSKNGFFSFEYQGPVEAARARRAVLSGVTRIEQVESEIEIPDGTVQHWRGTIFIPGVTLDSVYTRVEDPQLEDTRQEDVLDSRVLERSPGQIKLYLKLQRTKVVTVVYNTEHLVRFQRYSDSRASSSSIATKIAEIEKSGQSERERPQGHDRGFLWKLNSYWRYQQLDGGVIVECESMSLSRSIPPVLAYLVRPLANSVARESMQRTLHSLRTRITEQIAAGR
jgi:hypothetical protein